MNSFAVFTGHSFGCTEGDFQVATVKHTYVRTKRQGVSIIINSAIVS